jgi:hypothetical protein
LDIDFADMGASQAQERSLSMASEHFEAVNSKVLISRIQEWQLALSWEQGYWDLPPLDIGVAFYR